MEFNSAYTHRRSGNSREFTLKARDTLSYARSSKIITQDHKGGYIMDAIRGSNKEDLTTDAKFTNERINKGLQALLKAHS
jgi:hypothetical protein